MRQRVRLRHALLDQLSGSETSVPGSKTSTIDDTPGYRLRADGRPTPCTPFSRFRLERTVISCSTFLGGEPERLGLDLGVRWAELGEDIDGASRSWTMPRTVTPTRGDDEQPEAEARPDDGADHRRRSPPLGFALTLTVLVVRFPAFGELETTLPRPRIRYLHLARLSFPLAFLTLRPRTFGTLQLRFLFGATIGRGAADGVPGEAVFIRPILSPRNSVNRACHWPGGDVGGLAARRTGVAGISPPL